MNVVLTAIVVFDKEFFWALAPQRPYRPPVTFFFVSRALVSLSLSVTSKKRRRLKDVEDAVQQIRTR